MKQFSISLQTGSSQMCLSPVHMARKRELIITDCAVTTDLLAAKSATREKRK